MRRTWARHVLVSHQINQPQNFSTSKLLVVGNNRCSHQFSKLIQGFLLLRAKSILKETAGNVTV